MAIPLMAALAVALSLIAPQARPAAAQDSVTVEIADFAFSPASITIAAGTTVTWVNQDAVNHTATGSDGSFDTGQLATGQSASITFDTPGTYNYICSIHPEMTGTIVVQAAGDGMADDDATQDGTTEDDSTQLPTTGAGSSAGGPVNPLVALAALGALVVAVGGAALRRRVV